MKKLIPTTLIALLISISGFSQTVKEPVKNPSGGTSVNQASNSQLILLSPADDKLFNGNENSKPVIFRWTALVPKPKEAVTYRLKVWQLMQGQNGAEAMRTNQPVKTKDVVNITQAAISNLYTGPCKPPYLCDFVWAVEVLNSEGFSIGNSHAGSNSFKFDIENQVPVKAQADNKGNAGNTGMSGGKTLNADGDSTYKYKTYQPGKPIYGNVYQNGDVESEVYSFEYGPKAPKDLATGQSSGKSMDRDPYSGLQTGKSLDKPPFSSHPFNLPVKKIIYDADGNILAMSVSTKKGEANVLLDEKKIIEVSKKQIDRLKISTEDYIKSLRKFIMTGEGNPQMGVWPIQCWYDPCDLSCNSGPSCPGILRCKWVGFAR